MSVLAESYDLPRFTAPPLCAETDPEAFYPEKGGSAEAAKRLCARCEARDECLAYALDRGLDNGWDGVWGGTTPRERRWMLRDRERSIEPLTAVQDVVIDEPPSQDLLEREPVSEEAADEVVELTAVRAEAQEPQPVRPTARATSAVVTIARGWADDELVDAVATCTAAGMTRQEIAAALGVSVAAVRRAAAELASEAA